MRAVASILARLNPPRWWQRWPIKVGVGLVATILVLFPRVDLLVKNVGHWARLDALIEPETPGLEALEARVRERLGEVHGEAGGSGEVPSLPLRTPTDEPLLPRRALGEGEVPAREVLAVVERVVHEAVPYAWDWETWGVADYVPRAHETLAKGREDCDGRAVVAASLLKRMGYDARLMSDLGHVWVWTPEGQTMSPSQLAGGEVFVQQTAEGSRLNWAAVFNWRALVFDWGRNVAYGIAVFPLWREVVLVAVFWGLALGARPRWVRAVVGLGLTLAGVGLMKVMCREFWDPAIWASWLGLGLGVWGLIWTLMSGSGLKEARVASAGGSSRVGVSE